MGYLGRSPTPSPIDSSDIPDNSIDASKITDGSIELAEIADNSITDAKLANSVNTDIATGVTGNTTANAALPKAGGTMTGLLGIGGASDGSDLHLNKTNSKLRMSDGTKFLTLGQWDTATNRVESNGADLNIVQYGASSNIKLSTNAAERLRINSTGNLVHQGSGGVEVFYAHGSAGGSTALSVDVPCDDDGSVGTVFHIEASMTHHPSYDCILETWLSCRGVDCTNYEQFRRNTSTSGAWSVSRTSNTNLRVSKSAGSYAGSGPWWVRVTYRRV